MCSLRGHCANNSGPASQAGASANATAASACSVVVSNSGSATSAAPYTLRARTNLPASTPLDWRDLESIDAPEDLNYSSLPGLVAASGDPWAGIDAAARDLPVPKRVQERRKRAGGENGTEG